MVESLLANAFAVLLMLQHRSMANMFVGTAHGPQGQAGSLSAPTGLPLDPVELTPDASHYLGLSSSVTVSSGVLELYCSYLSFLLT